MAGSLSSAKSNVGFATVLVVLCLSMFLGTGPVRADQKSAQADPYFRAAIDIYGEYVAALGISESCPKTLNKAETVFVKARIGQYVQAIKALSKKHGMDSKETSYRLNALGQNNLKEIRQEVSSKGCSSTKIRRTIDTVKRAVSRQG